MRADAPLDPEFARLRRSGKISRQITLLKHTTALLLVALGLIGTFGGHYASSTVTRIFGDSVSLRPRSTSPHHAPTAGAGLKAPPVDLPEKLQKAWAMYSPYFSSGEYVDPPAGCVVSQVNLIQRHGARFPTKGSGTKIASAVAKLSAVKEYNNEKLDFLDNFTYTLGKDDLIPFGAAQSFDAGGVEYHRYSGLVSENSVPFVRAASSQRVVDTATNWTAGFANASMRKIVPKLDLIISEEGNVTLDDNMCPNAGDSDVQTDEWLAIFAPSITKRLNGWAPGANLTDMDAYSLISLCPFHTLYAGSPSPFCDLFTLSEFEQFAYSGDLSKYYGTGYGQKLGPVQGVGYINELLARLTNKPVQDNTQTNRTLDSSPTTFPLNRTFYADFSHDNEMIAIYSALGLFHQSKPLDPTNPDPQRTWITWKLVSFSARMVVERVQCGQDASPFVRIFVNDALQPLEFCDGATETGLCALDQFVASQGYAINDGEGDWEKCLA